MGKTKKNKGISLKTLLLLLAIFLVLGFGGTMWFYAIYKVAWVDYLPVEVRVPSQVKKIGISADPDLYFGDVPPGGISRKEVTVWNDKPYDVVIHIYVTGEVASWVYVSDNNFVLGPDENKKMYFFARVPNGTPLAAEGESDPYYGEVKIQHLRA